ncbi:MAG: CrcB family protein [Firmicutes bacterium]|nr:CrcB family protein [Bacillota bacterium]
MENSEHFIDLRNISPDIEMDKDLSSRQSSIRKTKYLYLIVSITGAVGALTRYFVSGLVATPSDGFPLATFVINMTGTFFLALVLILILERFPKSTLARPLLATGFCGAYTTFSTFMVEESLLLKSHNFTVGFIYLAAATVAGLLATFLGVGLARFFYKLDFYLRVQENIRTDSKETLSADS